MPKTEEQGLIDVPRTKLVSPDGPVLVRLSVRRLDVVGLDDAASLGEAVQARAQRFRHEADRRRFLAGRIAARALVAAHLQVPEHAVTATARCPDPGCRYGNDGSHGEPRYFLAGNPVSLGISFSRCGEWLAAAVAAVRVGVDLEDAASEAFLDAGLEDVMATDAEKAVLAAVEPRDRNRLRAQLWVRKEALLKAGGQGLRMDPRMVEALPGADQPPGAGTHLEAHDVGPEKAGLPGSFVVSYALDASGNEVRVEIDGPPESLP